jgi:acyl carrier protein
MSVEIKEDLLEFVNGELLNHQAKVTAEDELLMSGLIDSLGVMRLVAHVEEAHGLRIPPEDITIEHFSTIDSISRYAGRLLDR